MDKLKSVSTCQLFSGRGARLKKSNGNKKAEKIKSAFG
jgi:hypothetical protein